MQSPRVLEVTDVNIHGLVALSVEGKQQVMLGAYFASWPAPALSSDGTDMHSLTQTDARAAFPMLSRSNPLNCVCVIESEFSARGLH